MESELWLHKEKKFQRSGPDGLEAWGVAAATFFINFIMAGITRTSGILYVEFLDAFQVDRMQAALPFTIRSVSRNLLGPVVGIFGQKYGVRPVILVGGVLATVSTIACFFVTDIFWTSVFWGCFSGLGAAMIMTLNLASIGEHFKKHISTASGLAVSGGCFGSFVFPALFESLIEEYTVQGTFLFIAGMIMHVFPAAIIMKKPTWLKKQRKKESVLLINGTVCSIATAVESEITSTGNFKTEHNKSELLSRNGSKSNDEACLIGNNRRFSGDNLPSNMNKVIDAEFLWSNRKLVIRLLTDDGSLEFPPLEVWKWSSSQEEVQIKEVISAFSKIAKDVLGNPIDVKSSNTVTTHNGNIETYVSEEKDKLIGNGQLNSNLDDFTLNPVDCLLDLLEKFFERDKNGDIFLHSEVTSEDQHKLIDEFKYTYLLLQRYKNNVYENNFRNSQLTYNNLCNPDTSAELSNTFFSHIKTALWLHAKPLFLLTCLCRCVHFITFQPILTTVVDFSRDKGLPEKYGKFAIGTLAFGDLFGRLFLGWLTDNKYLSLPRYMFIFMILQGLCTISIALTNSAESLLPVLTVYGLLQGGTFIQHPVLISHYMGENEQSIALGCLNFFPGIIGFAMPFYIGYFRDIVGSYDGMFYINGSIGCFIGILWLTEPYLLRCTSPAPQDIQEIAV